MVFRFCFSRREHWHYFAIGIATTAILGGFRRLPLGCEGHRSQADERPGAISPSHRVADI